MSHCCSPEQNSSWVQPPLHWLGFVLGSVSSLGHLLGLASVTDPWSSSKGRFLLRHLLWWLSLGFAVKPALPMLFKGKHISSLSSPVHICPGDCLCLGYTGPSTEKPADHSSPAGLCTAPSPWICELHCNGDTEEGPRQGTCLKSQRSPLEDSWISSHTCGTAGQPLSQGHCGMGKVNLGNPNWPAVALWFQLYSTEVGEVHCWISEHTNTGFYRNTKHCWYYC